MLQNHEIALLSHRLWQALHKRDATEAIACLRQGAPPRTPDPRRSSDFQKSRDTPVMLALSWNDAALFDALMDAGLGPNERITPSAASLSLLGAAVLHHCPHAVSTLLARGADLDMGLSDGQGLWHLLARGLYLHHDAAALRAVAVQLVGLEPPNRRLREASSTPAHLAVLGAASNVVMLGQVPGTAEESVACFEVLMDPAFGWDWDSGRKGSTPRDRLAKKMPEVMARLTARAVHAKLGAALGADCASSTARPRARF